MLQDCVDIVKIYPKELYKDMDNIKCNIKYHRNA